jgi:uncharacterized coiled-coil protein SlyX
VSLTGAAISGQVRLLSFYNQIAYVVTWQGRLALLSCRSHAEQQLMDELRQSRAKAARLEDEVARMRRLTEQLRPVSDTALASQLHNDVPLLSEGEREALLVAAIPAAQKATASIIAFQRYGLGY